MIIDVELEDWGGSAVIRSGRADRKPAADYDDKAARLTARQAVFYRNLIRIAEKLGSNVIPVDFELGGGAPVFLDRGCIKIAEHAGFVLPLADGPTGVVDSITLNWRV